jgi:phosphohistidine phosphatase
VAGKRREIMELYLMQHGEALPKEVDPNRPLSPEGEEQVRIAGLALVRLGVRLERIVSSPKKRARQTAQAIADAIGVVGEIPALEALEPLTPPEETLLAIENVGDAGSILLAGHLPSLSEVAAYLMNCQSPIAFRMGGIGCLRVDHWGKGGAMLRWYLTPEQLKRISD